VTRLALTGATGTVGPALLGRLGAQPDVERVAVLGRTEPARMPQKARFVRADIRDRRHLEEALRGSETVIHLAFDLYGVLAGEEDLFRTNVIGTRDVAEAAAAVGARRLIYTSSSAVYGFHADNPQPLSEEDAMRASSRHFYGRQKAQTELVLRELAARTGIELVVFRPGAIIGPHAAGALASRLPRWLRGGAGSLLRGLAAGGLRPALPVPPVPVQYLHEDDVAQALELAVLGEDPAGTYNLAGEGAVNGEEALRLLGFRVLPLPRLASEAGARTLSAMPSPVPAARWMELFTVPQLLDTARARQRLGWRPRFSSRAALAATRQAIGW
jgi:UDP-glucose 4-epimerase